MKTYIVYLYGEENGTVKAGSHNSAEKKARARHPLVPPAAVNVAYTEV